LILWIWSILLDEENLIELAYLGGLFQREISKRTGIPLGIVKSRTASAFKRLSIELALGAALQEAIR
jgi:DNA-directed RNA polymerase specialized sigma24 family protein